MKLYTVTQYFPNFFSRVTPCIARNVALEDIEYIPWIAAARKQPGFYQIIISRYTEDEQIVEMYLQDGKHHVLAFAKEEKPTPTLESTAQDMDLTPSVVERARMMFREYTGSVEGLGRQSSEYWIGWLLQAARKANVNTGGQ